MQENYFQGLEWRKSRHSMANGACVEVASAARNIAIRDSKDPGGPVLSYSATSWRSFVGAIRSGSLDIPRL